MVPTFTCGLLRSNFCLAIASLLPTPGQGHGGPDALSLSAISAICTGRLRNRNRSGLLPVGPGDDLLGDRLGNLVIRLKLHRVRGATLGARTQVGSVAEHVGQRYRRVDHVAAALLIHALHLASAGGEVPD